MRRALVFVSFALLVGCGGSNTAGTGGSSATSGAGGSSGSSGSSGSGTSAGSSGSSGSSGTSASDAGSDCPEYKRFADGGTLGPDPWEDLAAGHTVSERGALLRCVHFESLTAVQLQSSGYLPAADPAQYGLEGFFIQYLSVGRPDEPRAVTALLYAPSGDAGALPLVAVDHGTSGMGPNCGPTKNSLYADYMAYPIVANGYAAVATDYAGMGVDDGLSPYLDGDAEAANAIDAVRAAKQVHDSRFDASRLSGELFVMGHSQGGQASLFTHQEVPSDLGMNLLGSVDFAPAFGDLRNFNQVFTSTRSTTAFDVFIAMALYGDTLGHDGRDAGAIFSTDAVANLPPLLHDQCLTDLFSSVPQSWPTLGDLYDANFITAAQSCDFTGACPSFEPWHGDLAADIAGNFTSSAPALIMQGESDTTVSPYTTACIVKNLDAHATPNHACGYAGVDHLGIVQASMTDVLTWMSARRQGQDPDVCPAPLAEQCP